MAPDQMDVVPRRALLALGVAGGAGVSALALGQRREASAPAVAPPAGAADLRSFGAHMDAVTDDSAALRAAAVTKRVIYVEGPMRLDAPVDLPPETVLQGAGVHRARIVFGESGRLRVAGPSFERRAGGGLMRDLTISPPDGMVLPVGVEFKHIDHFLFDNVTFYQTGIVLDDHHYVSFRDCRFFGDAGKVMLTSNCASQPRGRAAISEVIWFTRCFFSAFPVVLEDTVGARFTDCASFAGPFGIRSTRRLARGSDVDPFFMGPVVTGCVLDSIRGPAIDIEGGGTDCRLISNFISSGRETRSPGVRLTGSSGVELVGNRFEWCGSSGLSLEGCERIGVIGGSFANIAEGPGILARRSREVRVIGNAFENRPRWGGSGAGATTLAVACDDGCADWVVTGNTAADLRDARVARIPHGLVEHNGGWPPSTEGGWPSGRTDMRPKGVRDGYRWYDQGLGLWLHWHQGSQRWRRATGEPA